MPGEKAGSSPAGLGFQLESSQQRRKDMAIARCGQEAGRPEGWQEGRWAWDRVVPRDGQVCEGAAAGRKGGFLRCGSSGMNEYRGSKACVPPRVLPSKGRAVVTETSQEKVLWEKGMGWVFSTKQHDSHSGWTSLRGSGKDSPRQALQGRGLEVKQSRER